jgi:hypothetical protein
MNEWDADLQKTGVCKRLRMLSLRMHVFVPIWEFVVLNRLSELV